MFQRCFRGVSEVFLEVFQSSKKSSRRPHAPRRGEKSSASNRSPQASRALRERKKSRGADSPRARLTQKPKASQGQFKFNPSRRGWCFATLYIKYQNECARGLRRQTCNLKVPGSSPGNGATRELPDDRGLREQSNHHAEQSNSTQACRPAQR